VLFVPPNKSMPCLPREPTPRVTPVETTSHPPPFPPHIGLKHGSHLPPPSGLGYLGTLKGLVVPRNSHNFFFQACGSPLPVTLKLCLPVKERGCASFRGPTWFLPLHTAIHAPLNQMNPSSSFSCSRRFFAPHNVNV